MSINKPYSNTFHPYKTWFDKILQLVVFRPMNRIIKIPWICKNGSDTVVKNYIEALRHNTSFKERLCAMVLTNKSKEFFEKVVSIPRNNNVLKSFCDIPLDEITTSIINSSSSRDDDKVKVSILCPHHLRPKLFPNENDHEINFHDVDSSIPIVINFHGGGFMIGSSLDLYTKMSFDRLVRAQKKKTNKSPEFIFLSVEYRLAPEHPFPCGVIDCLSVMEHVLSAKCSPTSRKFHLAGTSAGGNYCTMVTMECLRRFGDCRISSAFIDIPFLDPKADSLSYYQNSKSSIVPWLIWCWRAYLSMEYTNDSKDDFTVNTTLVQQSEWMKKDENSNTIFRLIHPTIGVPPARSNTSAIEFIVVTSLADPLHDEGVDLVHKIEQMGYTDLKHFETMSAHASYMLCDRSMTKRIYTAWSSYVFQT